MRNETIAEIIAAVNAGEAADWAFHRMIAAGVTFGRVWRQDPGRRSWDPEGYEFYFVLGTTGECIAAVLDMGCDLHVFVTEHHRRRGVMFRALRDVILPHIFSRGRKRQDVTFESPESRSLLAKLGFDFIDERRAFITADKLANVTFPPPAPRRITAERLEAIEQRMLHACALVRMVRDEVEGALEDRLRDDLDFLGDAIRDDIGRIHDEWHASEAGHVGKRG